MESNIPHFSISTKAVGQQLGVLAAGVQGSGEPALSIAKSLPACEVVSTDFAPGMVEQAKRRGQGVPNFRCRGFAAYA